MGGPYSKDYGVSAGPPLLGKTSVENNWKLPFRVEGSGLRDLAGQDGIEKRNMKWTVLFRSV